MDLRNCPHCGKLFAYDGKHRLCPVCRKDEDNKFKKVKDYLWDNPHATIEEVHDETGVERELILKFIKDDRLVAEGIDLDILLECERCGTPITHGRFCKDCQQELIDGFSPRPRQQQPQKHKKVRDEMYIADRIKKRKN